MNNLDRQYLDLLQDILDNGVKKEDRTGTGTLSVFGKQIRHKMSEGFPLLTTKKMAWKTMVVELLWFLKGDTDIRYLWKHNCHIWDGDWYSNYSKSCSTPYSLEEMIQFGLEWEENLRHFGKYIWELGTIYGAQWRDWNGRQTDGFVEYESNGYNEHIKGIDQIQNLINELKTNPDSRRLMVNAWNVSELPNMVLPPCHYGFQVWTRELSLNERRDLFVELYPNTSLSDFTPTGMEVQSLFQQLDTRFNKVNVPKRAISLSWNQRSVDVGLGLPFNIASYGLFLHLIANEVDMVPDEIIGNLGDTHVYFDHIEGLKEQLEREPFKLPYVSFLDEYHYLNDKELVGDLSFDRKIQEFRPDMFMIKDYQSHPKIVLPLSN